ncbi:hypothetical protein HHI36_008459, partial [Cryptolaemus montrouzieri]
LTPCVREITEAKLCQQRASDLKCMVLINVEIGELIDDLLFWHSKLQILKGESQFRQYRLFSVLWKSD